MELLGIPSNILKNYEIDVRVDSLHHSGRVDAYRTTRIVVRSSKAVASGSDTGTLYY
jgi:hypothetical protein